MFEQFFAGLWPLITSNLFGIGGVIGLGVLAWFIPSRFTIAMAVGAALGLLAYNVGVKHEHARMEAQRVIRERQFGEQLDKARADAQKTVTRRTNRDRPGIMWNENSDKYDRAK